MRNNKSGLPGLCKATVYVNWLILHSQFYTHSVQDKSGQSWLYPNNNHNTFISTHTKIGRTT